MRQPSRTTAAAGNSRKVRIGHGAVVRHRRHAGAERDLHQRAAAGDERQHAHDIAARDHEQQHGQGRFRSSRGARQTRVSSTLTRQRAAANPAAHGGARRAATRARLRGAGRLLVSRHAGASTSDQVRSRAAPTSASPTWSERAPGTAGSSQRAATQPRPSAPGAARAASTSCSCSSRVPVMQPIDGRRVEGLPREAPASAGPAPRDPCARRRGSTEMQARSDHSTLPE